MNRTFPSSAAWTLLSAFLFAASFPSFFDKSLHPIGAVLAWIALVPLLRVLENADWKRQAALGFLWGFTAYGTIQYWVLFLEEADYLAVPGWAVMGIVIGFYYLVWAVAYGLVRRRFPKVGLFTAPILWTALEYFRTETPLFGYPWGLAGTSQAPFPSILTLTSFLGVWGLTFLVVWVNAALTELWESRARGVEIPRQRQAALATPLAVLFLVLFMGNLVTRETPSTQAGFPQVALVQPSIDQSVKWSPAMTKETYDRLERLTGKASEQKPGLLVWPETAAPSYLSLDPAAMNRVRTIARMGKAPLLVGCLDAQKTESGDLAYFNAALALDAEGREQPAYHKRHLVPFGEFVPFQKFFFFLGPLVSELGSFRPGDRYRDFKALGFTYTPLICYEGIFPNGTREAVRNVDAIVNISNDAWYGTTAAAYQHALLAVVRAAENRKPLLRCANTGISLVTDSWGRIKASTKLFEETVLVAPVEINPGRPTFYARFGDLLAILCSTLSLFLVLGGLTLGIRERRKVVEIAAKDK